MVRTVHSIRELTDGAIRIQPLTGIGYSNAALSRVFVREKDGSERPFVLKRTHLANDWTTRRTADETGREALLLADSALATVWEVFACPYAAFATGPGEVALLMDDLTDRLLPDVRVPLSGEQEAALFGTLARLHARFWNAPALAREWLVQPSQYCDLLAPCAAADPATLAVLSPMLRDNVPHGWACVFAMVAGQIAWQLARPGAEWDAQWADLPRTLLHGDVKVANFAIMSDGRVAAFDWAMTGNGPCTIDLGWYLAVNASRLTAPKERVIARYRALLEASLGEALPQSVWTRLEDVAIVTGARMMLWSKALAADSGRPGAADEWTWWIERLSRVRDP